MIRGVSLVPEVVIGSTTSSINGLSAAVDTNAFAFCAGSSVVLAVINSRLGLDQRLFSAKPNASPVQPTPSYYNPSTPTKTGGNRGHPNSLFRDETASSSAPGDQNTDSPTRIKAARRSRRLTSVSLSPSGKFLAIGETGYLPRVLVFSTESAASTDVPLTCLTEHTFGVRALAFSHDSRWLCSLGDLHDGGLFLWSVDPKTGVLRLDSSNRCTTADTIGWMGTSVVSVGTRNVKIWRSERPLSPSKARRGVDSVSDGSTGSPVPRTFVGRNCLLGPLKDATFTCVVGISADKAVLATQDGAVCILDDTNRSQHLYQVSKKPYRVTCITLDRSFGVVWIGGEGVEPDALPLDALLAAKDASVALEEHKVPDVKAKPNIEDVSTVFAICWVDRRLVTINSSRNVRIYDVALGSGDTIHLTSIQMLPSHDSAILGVLSLSKPNESQSDFLTYSERGQVLHWLWDGTCTRRYSIQLDQPFDCDTGDPNELRVVRVFPGCKMLLAGDKAGFLRLLSTRGEDNDIFKAHDGEVADLALHGLDGEDTLAASCGRDRSIQIFLISNNKCSLQHSKLNEHAGPIRRLEFAEKGSLLASMSPDRTIVLHRKVLRTDGSIAFVSTKVINFKATLLAMSLLPNAAPTLLVSAMDRCIRKISLSQGRITHTFKASDHLSCEPAAVSRLSTGSLDQQQSTGASVVLGFSSADRSIRLYDLETGLLLALDYGQTAISDLALVEEASMPSGHIVNRIISTGHEGTITIWRIAQKNMRYGDGNRTLDLGSAKSQPLSMQRPLRRMLSKTEIAEHQQSLENQSGRDSNPSSNLSPSPLRRKTSRFAFNAASEASDPSFTDRTRSAHPPTRVGRQRNHLKDPLDAPSSEARLRLRPRRASLDARYREMAVTSIINISSTATQLAGVLEKFQKQLIISKESLGFDRAQTLQRELRATSELLARTCKRSDASHEGTGTSSFDDFLAKLIDERLALRFQSEDKNEPTDDADSYLTENSGSLAA
ncbi:MAG: hypothetical protein Q9211_001003 [Gyalolechia sp. 1 TL-2023]